MLSPKEFVARWGKDGTLVRFRKDAVAQLALADGDKIFLAQAGLPDSAAPFLNFEAPKSGELPTVALAYDQPAEFHRYRVIGFDGAGNPIAIDEGRASEVVCLDHEEKFARTFMNKTIRQLAQSLLAYRKALRDSVAANAEEDDSDDAIPPAARKKLFAELKKIDSAAMKTGCFWADEIQISDAKADYPAKVLRDLCSSNPSLRLSASRHLQSELRKGASKQREEQFGNREATTPLIRALDDPAPEVVRNAMIALAIISAHYFKDDTAYGKVIEMLRCKDVMTQSWAVCAAIRLRGQDSLNDVLPLCKDRSPIVRDRVLYELFRWLFETRPDGVGSLRPESQKQLQKVALNALNAEPEARGGAAFLLCELGDDASLAAVWARLKKERDRNVKQSIKQALESVER
jgi:HEAT repeat protein